MLQDVADLLETSVDLPCRFANTVATAIMLQPAAGVQAKGMVTAGIEP